MVYLHVYADDCSRSRDISSVGLLILNLMLMVVVVWGMVIVRSETGCEGDR